MKIEILQKDELIKQKDKSNKEKDELIKQRDEIIKQKDKSNKEKDELIKQKEEDIDQKDKSNKEKDELIKQKDEVIKQRDEWIEQIEKSIIFQQDQYIFVDIGLRRTRAIPFRYSITGLQIKQKIQERIGERIEMLRLFVSASDVSPLNLIKEGKV
jgi:hypothetical protein